MVHLQADPHTSRGTEDPLVLRLASLEATVAALQRRVEALEGGAQASPLHAAAFETLPAEAASEVTPAGALALAGRALLILGGAFLIRALTEGGTLPKGLGVAAGFLYAGTWAIFALRGGRASGSLHAILSASLLLPLLYEATTRFQVLSPGLAALCLGLSTAGLLSVAWRRDLHGAAWTTLLAALGTEFVLMAQTGALPPFTAVFLVQGGGILWLTYGRRWHGLRWPAALMADLSVLVLTTYAAAPGGPPAAMRGLTPAWAMTLSLGLTGIYLGSIAIRTLQRSRKVNAFEMIQTLLALGVGFGGAVRVALASGSGLVPFGLSALAVGAACYAVAFAFMEKKADSEVNFFFFTTLALLCTLVGGFLVVPRGALVSVLGALGALALGLGVRQHRWVLRSHGAVYLSAVAILLAVPQQVALAFWTTPPLLSTRPAWPLLGFAAALSVAHLYTVTGRAKIALVWWRRLPAFVLGLWALAALGTLAVLLPATALSDAAAIAALRTAVLAALALGAAYLPAWAETTEMVWLIYPLLALAALKVLFEALPAGRPLPLAIGFACLGAALLLAPRARKGRGATGEPPASKL